MTNDIRIKNKQTPFATHTNMTKKQMLETIDALILYLNSLLSVGD
jgi:hypothetical protein